MHHRTGLFPVLAWLAAFSALLLGEAGSSAQAAPPPLQETPRVDFALNRDFLLSGGIQYHYAFIPKEGDPESSASFQWLKRFDFPGYWRNRGAADYAVVLGRMAYVVEKPIEYFRAERVLGLDHLKRMIPDQEIRALGQEQGFSVFSFSGPPSCEGRLKHLERDDLEALPQGSVERLLADLLPELGRAAAVGLQRNDRFGTVMGFKTAQGAVALTAHYALDSKRTLIHVVNLNYLHNIPPAFLGGEDRVKEEARKATLELVQRLRALR
jgi:hypothetical protein